MADRDPEEQRDWGEDDGQSNVIDEEGGVDKKIKNRILNSRKRVDDAERAIFVDAATDPNVRMNRPEQIAIWGIIVKQYVRNVEPILKADEIAGAERYYRDVDLGDKVLIPPKTDGRDFSIVRHGDLSDSEIKDVLNLPLAADVPKPKRIGFTGLKDIIELPEAISEQWRVLVRDGVDPEYVTIEATGSVPKETYNKAVRETDAFLQQAGIGIETGHEEKDDPQSNPI